MNTTSERYRNLLMSWRDRQVLQLHQLLNVKAIEAREAFEQQLEQASFWDSAWDPAGFANCRLDTLLADMLEQPLQEYFELAGNQLGSIDERFADLGKVVRDGPGDIFPALKITDDQPSQEKPPIESSAHSKSQSWFQRVGGIVAGSATQVASYTADTTDWLVQDKVGLRNRLRHAALDRIAITWMGDIGEPTPVLRQVIGFIDAATDQARLAAW